LVKAKPTVALFGGSFDPPHEGHRAIVNTLTTLDDIDKVIVMPAFLNPFKKSTLASPAQRLEWCRKTCHGPRVLVSDWEISQGRAVYTIETLRALQTSYRVKYLVIGMDNLADIASWKEFDKINQEVTWLLFTREGSVADYSKLSHYRVIPLDLPTSATRIRAGKDLDQLHPDILNEVKKRINQHKDIHDNQRES